MKNAIIEFIIIFLSSQNSLQKISKSSLLITQQSIEGHLINQDTNLFIHIYAYIKHIHIYLYISVN